FFQAEDGIRDYKVTGVQTCALPICHGLQVVPDCILQEAPALDLLIVPGGLGARTHARENPQILEFVRRQRGTVVSVCTGALILRSEERRVGKECRSWWLVDE